MAAETRTVLNSYFQTGDTPTQGQFGSVFDSFWHKLDDTIDWSNIGGKPTTFAPAAHSHAWTDITGKPVFATVATSGAYADLTGIPSTFAPSAHSHSWTDITGKPTTFAPSAHSHAAGDITSGTFAAAQLAAGTATDGYIIKSVSGTPTWDVAPSGGGGGWGLLGNAGTTTGTNFFGTTDNVRADVRSNNVIVGKFYPLSSVAFGEGAQATGYFGFAGGYGAKANGQHSAAINGYAEAMDTGASAFGYSAKALHPSATVLGGNGGGGSYTSTYNFQTLIGGYGGIDFQIMAGTNIMRIMQDGTVRILGMPVFASDAAASTLAANTLYKTSTGEVRIKL